MGNYFNRTIDNTMRVLSKRLPGLASLVLFMLLCACMAYWAMQLLRPPLRAVVMPPHNEESTEVDISHAIGLFGAQGLAKVASNYQLTGVVVAQQAEKSVAILSIDGKPAQAVMQGGELQPGIRIKEVHATYVVLSKSGIVERVMLQEDTRPVLVLQSHRSQ